MEALYYNMNKQQIFEADDRPMKQIDVPEWGGSLTMRKLSVADRLALFDVVTAAGEDKLFHIYSIIYSIVGSDGNRMFDDEDYEGLAQKDSDVVLRVGRECIAFNRLLGNAVDEAKNA